MLDRDIAILKSGLLWDREALKALIDHGVNQSAARRAQCAGLVDRHLFGARPFDYGPWCLDQALAADGHPDAESLQKIKKWLRAVHLSY